MRDYYDSQTTMGKSDVIGSCIGTATQDFLG
jgi:hypothetical protein